MIEFKLCCIFLILVIVLILKYILQYSETYSSKYLPNLINTQRTKTCHDKNCMCNKNMSVLLRDMEINTNSKINYAEEQGIIEGFEAVGGEDGGYSAYGLYTNDKIDGEGSGGRGGGSGESGGGSKNETIISYNNRESQIKLILYYKTSCHYCTEFLPTWYKIINNLPNDILYEEINIDKDNESNKKANSNKISSVPTIILNIDNNKKIYMGNRTYNDIEKFLKVNGVNLVARTFEEFDDGYSSTPSPTPVANQNCPAVTFDKQIDLANDVYMYQIFSDGQYGYASGGTKPGNLMSPFSAAYSIVDSYLNSIPDTKNMNECASLYASDIIGLGLCDTDNLSNILTYKDNINSGEYTSRINGTNYDSNKKVVNAIKYACDM